MLLFQDFDFFRNWIQVELLGPEDALIFPEISKNGHSPSCIYLFVDQTLIPSHTPWLSWKNDRCYFQDTSPSLKTSHFTEIKSINLPCSWTIEQ